MVYACMMAALTPWHAGFPPRGGVGAGQSFNAWPHIAGAFLVIVAWLIYRDSKRAHRGDSASSLKQDEGAS